MTVLPKMKCPYVIEPHQIQGLDFINIFPVIQWLVKRSVENRTEKAEKLKAFAVGQFHNHFSLKSDRDAKQKYTNAVACVKNVQDFYSPRRKYKRKDAGQEDEKTRVRVTLLEYGNKGTTHLATASRSKTTANAASKDDADGTDGGGDVLNASNEVVQVSKIDSSFLCFFAFDLISCDEMSPLCLLYLRHRFLRQIQYFSKFKNCMIFLRIAFTLLYDPFQSHLVFKYQFFVFDFCSFCLQIDVDQLLKNLYVANEVK